MLGLVETKVLSLTSMGAASLVLGLLPLWLRRAAPGDAAGDCPRHAAGAGPLLTALLSFGAGALLATALVHMLVEASEELPRAAPVALLVGFLVLYLVDELVQRVLGHSPAAARAHRAQPHAACPVDEPCPPSKSPAVRRRDDYGSMDESMSIQRRPVTSFGTSGEAVGLLSETSPKDKLPDKPEAAGGHLEGHGGAGAGGTASCWGLLLALCIHSVIEGLAVGLEETPQQVLFLLGAVSSHKLVVSFCLGAELVGGGVGLVPHLVAVLVFALGSAAGVGVGMVLYALPGAADASASDPMLLPSLQAAAAGTLLYVTLAEVLPRERARSQHNFGRRLLQFFSFTVGAVVITALVLYLPDDHNSSSAKP
ncbi:Zinc transporter ZIP1 [Frankliniella fusca]|uniref:Zinc transporter ZIP1 n=1 Tax=Frankliniella fusca TaxID=407009 RepID=A0AAE1LST4_9NEOP|nr:Zinc transporter ZIP1 [Frankliniella fusca]